MAYSPCANAIGANIAVDCSNPPRAGFVGEGVLINMDLLTNFAVSNTDPRIITNLVVASPDNVCMVDNLWRESMMASVALNVENGRPTYDKQIPIRIPARSAAASRDIVEPLAGGARYIGVFPTNDNRFIVLGWYGKLQPSEITQNEGENGGDFVATLAVNEPYAVVELLDTDYTTTKGIYEALKARAF